MVNRTDASNQQGGEVLTVEDNRADEEKHRDAAILRHTTTDLDSSRNDREERESHWDDYFNIYMCSLNEGKYPWRSNVYDPEGFAAIETIFPRVNNTLLAGPEIFGVKATEQNDVNGARKTQNLLNYQSDRMNLFERLGMIDKDGLIYGTGFGKAMWRKEYEPRIVMHPVLDAMGMPVMGPDGQPQMKQEKQFVKVYDDPWVDRVDIKDLYVDPEATCFEDARYVIHRVQRTKDYLRKKEAQGVFKNVNLIPKSDSSISDSKNRDDNRKAATYKQTAGSTELEVHDENMEYVTLHEYWGQYDIDGDGYLEECIIVIANGKTVIRADYNPFPGGFKPFIRFTPIPIPGEFYGMSLLKPIEGIQDALNDRTNQIADNISLLLNPMYVVSRHSDIDHDQLVSQPGGAIEVNQPGDIQRLDGGDIIGSVFPEVGRLENKISKALGTYDYAAGGAPQRQEAATTVISLQQVAEIRFKTILIFFERQVIRPLGNMLIKLNQEFMGPEREFRILGREAMMDYSQPEFQNMTQEDLVDNADIYAVGAAIDPSVSKQMQLQNLMQFMGIVASNPQLMMNPMFGIDWSVVIEELPFLLDLKLKRPLVQPFNAGLAYQDMKQEEQMVDGMMMGQMGALQGQMMAPAAESAPDKSAREAPSRTKGELAKKGGSKNGGKAKAS